MSNFMFSLNATLPVFLVIVLGWFLMQKKMFNENFVDIINKFVFKVSLPVLLFKDIATTPIRDAFDPKFVIFCMIGTTIMFMGIWALTSIFMKDKSMVGAFTQASARGSAAVLGIAFVQNIYGNSGMTPLMIVSAVPLYNIYSVIILTFCANNQDHSDNSATIKRAFKNILTNPIILGIAAGVPFSLLNIELPPLVLKTVTNVAQTATPMALLAVGAGFEGRKAIKKLKPMKWGLWETIQSRAFPGSVSNHHLGTQLGLLMAAYEMNYFKDSYQKAVIDNAKYFAKALHEAGLHVLGDPTIGYTETHQVLVDVGYGTGPEVAERLEENNIIVNYQATPTRRASPPPVLCGWASAK